ncbi:flavin-containing monooxygenase [Ornithinimicrobium sufpigmenti]|uniref:flavin-containing monooxygenase n=1 Tax=Ornithinimicrobium sufpigmenti TaxID=2508882 RepID=UPI00103689F5|nr:MULTISPECIES: NAD(P)/FAD-dependent oxidoreductase [unclassified Ornithinimicrobium]
MTGLADLGAPVDVDVVVVGAGLSGIGAAHRLRTALPHLRLEVLEARDDLGGTWSLFRYPGVRSDSDMFTLAYPFAPWREQEAIGSGAQILDYLRQTAAEHGITERVRLRHKVVGASFDTAAARWTLTVQTPEGRQERTCRFLHVCTGYYSYDDPHDAQVPGLADFSGDVVHPQFWPADLSYDGRRVVVVGSGATAITLVPALAQPGEDGQVAAQVTMLQRTPTWVGSIPSRDRFADRARWLLPAGPAHRLARTKNVLTGSALWAAMRAAPRLAGRVLTDRAARALGGDDAARDYVDAHLTPPYDPWDQRLCAAPDGDFFAALRSGRARIVTGTIERVVPEGVRLRTGEVVPADVLVTATGLRVQVAGGIEPQVDGIPVPLGEQLVWAGAMITGLPNFAFTVGYVNASWTLRSDLTARLVARVLSWMEDRGYAVAVPMEEREEPGMDRRPLMGLDAGYLRRAEGSLPDQGDRDPWRMRQSYLTDALAVRRLDLDRTLRGRRRSSLPERKLPW